MLRIYQPKLLSLHRTTESTNPRVMLHTFFTANNTSPSCRRGRTCHLRIGLRGPHSEAGVTLQRQWLIDKRTTWACPGVFSQRLGRIIDGRRPWLGQDVDTGKSTLSH